MLIKKRRVKKLALQDKERRNYKSMKRKCKDENKKEKKIKGGKENTNKLSR